MCKVQKIACGKCKISKLFSFSSCAKRQLFTNTLSMSLKSKALEVTFNKATL